MYELHRVRSAARPVWSHQPPPKLRTHGTRGGPFHKETPTTQCDRHGPFCRLHSQCIALHTHTHLSDSLLFYSLFFLEQGKDETQPDDGPLPFPFTRKWTSVHLAIHGGKSAYCSTVTQHAVKFLFCHNADTRRAASPSMRARVCVCVCTCVRARWFFLSQAAHPLSVPPSRGIMRKDQRLCAVNPTSHASRLLASVLI